MLMVIAVVVAATAEPVAVEDIDMAAVAMFMDEVPISMAIDNVPISFVAEMCGLSFRKMFGIGEGSG